MTDTVRETSLPALLHRGKVRDVYDLDDALMIVATDRISAFDVIMNEPIPDKGIILTRITEHWLRTLPTCFPHHWRYTVARDQVPRGYEPYVDQLTGRAMIVQKTHVLPVECVVRGYLAGGGWKEYCNDGSVSGIALPAGLQQAQRLDRPMFTPSTKATSGHDEPISFEQACAAASEFARGLGASDAEGRQWMLAARDRSLAIYTEASNAALSRGLILADTKFEFGVRDNELLLVDEVLTPDSSRYWPASEHRLGISPPSFDKQFLRDYLETLDWDKCPPPPTLPETIVQQTAARYTEALTRLVG